jgi:hypothetical protein
MSMVEHVIESDGYSSRRVGNPGKAARLRRLILMGLAAAMALATLAPVVVLAA